MNVRDLMELLADEHPDRPVVIEVETDEWTLDAELTGTRVSSSSGGVAVVLEAQA